jgi:hypothetical protein
MHKRRWDGLIEEIVAATNADQRRAAGENGFVSVRPEGACHQRRRIPSRELSIDLVADERL